MDGSSSVMKFDSLSEILPGREAWRIKVRVLRLWKVPAFLNPLETNSVEMVLLDEKGGKIHATIRKQMLYMFQSKVEEGEVYEMSFFSVAPSSGSYRTTLHPYKLVFQLKTKVQAVSCPDIKSYGLNLTKFVDIAGHVHDYEFLVDVIGLMTGMSVEREYARDGKITKMVVIELTDESGKCECALFGDYVEDLKRMIGKSSAGMPIVVVQFAKVKIFRDKASLQNVMNTTKIFINPNISEVEVFKNGLALHGIDSDSDVQIIGSRAKLPAEEEFLRSHPKKTIGQLLDTTEDGIFVVYGVVVSIIQGQDWWYPACKCHKSVVPDFGAYYCKGCVRHVFQIVPRFKVKVHVSDGDSTAVFILFDTDMSYIMEKSCASFVASAKFDVTGNIPAEFDSLVGQKMLFTVDKGSSVTPLSDGSFRVKHVSMDSKIIAKFNEEGPNYTPVKTVSPAIDLNDSDSADDVDLIEETQGLAFVADLIISPPIVKKDDPVVSPPVVKKPDPPLSVSKRTVKRNLTRAFDGVAAVDRKMPLKAVKIEKE